MKKNTIVKYVSLLTLTAFAACLALADQQVIPFTLQSGTTGQGCPGAWTGYAKMTNSSGGISITPPTNAVSGTLTDASGFPAPYTSVAYVKCSDFKSWCDTNSITFPATNTKTYQLTVFVKSTPPPPTNTQPMTLQITWQTQ